MSTSSTSRHPLVVLTRGADPTSLSPAATAAAHLAREICRRSGRSLTLLLPARGGADLHRASVLRGDLLSAGVRGEVVDSGGDPERERAALARADAVFAPRGWSGALPAECARWSVGPFSPRRIRRVVVAHDLEAGGRAALRLASEIAAATRAELIAVHAWPLAMSQQLMRGRSDLGAELRSAAALRAISLRRELKACEASRARMILAQGAPVDTLLAAAEELAPDLIVVGRSPRAALAARLSDTGDRLAARVPCAVITASGAPVGAKNALAGHSSSNLSA